MIILLLNIIKIYRVILIAKIFMSWIHPDPNNPIVNIINSITDPVLRPISDLLPRNGMGIDFSPIVVFFGLSIIERILLGGGYGYYGF